MMTNVAEGKQAERGAALDEDRLRQYCIGRMDDAGEGFEIDQILGGSSNPTYILTARASGKRYVLRKKPSGELLPSAHQVDREFRVMDALNKVEFPVPRMCFLCEDSDVVGTAFYVMEFVEGRIFRTASLPQQSPAERGAIYDELNDVLARLHSVDYEAIGLVGFGRAGNYYERQMARWVRQYRAAEPEDNPAMERLMDELNAAIPDDGVATISHGDYRLENMIFHPEQPKIIGVLDWELSTIGHPLADLAYNCLLYHSTSEAFGNLKDVDVKALGIPTEEEYVAAYCRRTGRTAIPDWNFYLAFSQFRLLAIGAGVLKRARDGISDASRLGGGGDGLAERATYALDLLHR